MTETRPLIDLSLNAANDFLRRKFIPAMMYQQEEFKTNRKSILRMMDTYIHERRNPEFELTHVFAMAWDKARKAQPSTPDFVVYNRAANILLDAWMDQQMKE